MSAEADEFIRAVMADMMDQQAADSPCMSDELCLSIDLGTGGPKIGLVSLDGEVLDYELHSVETTYTPDGGATQDPTAVVDVDRRRDPTTDGATRTSPRNACGPSR